ncbi:MAG: bleomycin resistance protein [Acidimicrobiaceae bacterium]|nr:bleomycin resistance protein [Acidimicrobiaceae bacterium]
MSIHFNHTIVHAHDREEEATFFTEMFGLPPAVEFGHFLAAHIADQASIDFVQHDGDEIAAQHYAFLVSENDFAGIHDRIIERDLDHWADPGQRRPGEINHHDGGRGVYFTSPSGHFLEAITCPYGGGDPV